MRPRWHLAGDAPSQDATELLSHSHQLCSTSWLPKRGLSVVCLVWCLCFDLSRSPIWFAWLAHGTLAPQACLGRDWGSLAVLKCDRSVVDNPATAFSCSSASGQSFPSLFEDFKCILLPFVVSNSAHRRREHWPLESWGLLPCNTHS
jgi:hypothetical protein